MNELGLWFSCFTIDGLTAKVSESSCDKESVADKIRV